MLYLLAFAAGVAATGTGAYIYVTRLEAVIRKDYADLLAWYQARGL